MHNAIRHHSYINGIVLGTNVNGTASTGDVVSHLLGTTVTTVAHGQSPAQHICAKSTDPNPKLV